MILSVHGIFASSISGFDADAQAFITAAGITDATQQAAINTLVVDLKGYGIWSKMKALYPFVGGSASSHKYNLKDPRDLDAAFRLVFNGGWTHSSTGATPNGTNGYADSKFVPSSVLSSQNSQHYSIYSRTNIAQSRYGFGSNDVLFALEWGDFHLYAKLGTSELDYGRNSSSLGFHLMSRTDATNLPVFVRNTKINKTSASTSLSGLTVLLGARQLSSSVDSYGTRELAFVSMGDGLSDTEASNLYTAVQAFQTSLSRQV